MPRKRSATRSAMNTFMPMAISVGMAGSVISLTAIPTGNKTANALMRIAGIGIAGKAIDMTTRKRR